MRDREGLQKTGKLGQQNELSKAHRGLPMGFLPERLVVILLTALGTLFLLLSYVGQACMRVCALIFLYLVMMLV